MFFDQIAAAVAAARHQDLDRLAALVWRGLAEGHLSEAEAEAASAVVETRRQIFRTGQRKPILPASEPHRRVQRSPDRERSIRRRRGLAASGAMPGSIAANFTTAEAAALSVIGREYQRNGRCEWPIDRIAAVAGVSRTSVQNAIRTARRLGLIDVTERRRSGARSEPNVVVVVSPEWRTWLKVGRSRETGFKKVSTTKLKIQDPVKSGSHPQSQPDIHWHNRTVPSMFEVNDTSNGAIHARRTR